MGITGIINKPALISMTAASALLAAGCGFANKTSGGSTLSASPWLLPAGTVAIANGAYMGPKAFNFSHQIPAIGAGLGASLLAGAAGYAAGNLAGELG